MSDTEERRAAWQYLSRVKRMGMLIQPDRIREFEELDKEFGNLLQDVTNAPATPRTVNVNPAVEEPTSPKIDKGKGRAIDGSPKYTTKSAQATAADRLKAEQMKYALQLQREQGRGESKLKSVKGGPSTPAKTVRGPGSATSRTRAVINAVTRAAPKPAASSSATNGSFMTNSKPASDVDVPFARDAAASSVSTFNAFVPASTTQSQSVSVAASIAPVGPSGGQNGSIANGLNRSLAISPVSMPATPASSELVVNGNSAQADHISRMIPPHLRASSNASQPESKSAAAEDEVKDKTGESVSAASSSPLGVYTNGFEDSGQSITISMARITKLEKQVAELIDENKALRKKFVSLEEKVDLLNAGGPAIMKPFMATVKYPCGNVEQIQIRGNMRVNELLEHAVAKRSIDLGQSSHLKLSYEGKVLGHLLYIGQVQPTIDGVFEISRA